jgi:hypothetical protein
LATNPFFRENSLLLQTHLNRVGQSSIEIFTALRKMKDIF